MSLHLYTFYKNMQCCDLLYRKLGEGSTTSTKKKPQREDVFTIEIGSPPPAETNAKTQPDIQKLVSSHPDKSPESVASQPDAPKTVTSQPDISKSVSSQPDKTPESQPYAPMTVLSQPDIPQSVPSQPENLLPSTNQML